jgi:hypothetical protein
MLASKPDKPFAVIAVRVCYSEVCSSSQLGALRVTDWNTLEHDSNIAGLDGAEHRSPDRNSALPHFAALKYAITE